jgi:transposase
MPNRLSQRERKRIIKLRLDEGLSRSEVAKELRLDRKTVLRYVGLFERTGGTLWKDERKGETTGTARSTIPKHVVAAAWVLLSKDPTLYLEEIATLLNQPPVMRS